MRVALISEHYPPTDGGVATSAKRIAHGLQSAGASVQVITFDYSRPLTEDDYVIQSLEGGVHLNRVGPFFLKHPFAKTNPLSEKARAILRRRAFGQMASLLDGKTDVILSLYLLQAGFLAQMVAHELGRPCVAGVRGNDIGLNIFHVERFAAIQWTLAHANAIACVNEHLRRRLLVAFPNAAHRTQTIPNGVALEARRVRSEGDSLLGQVESVRRWQQGKHTVAFIGRLREKKGVATLLKALIRIAPYSAVRLLVIGPDLDGMEHRIWGTEWRALQDAGLVYVTGQVPREDVPVLAELAQSVVMPSLDDGLANGLLEGMSLGLCPIVSDLFDDVVDHDVSGLVVGRGDDQGLAKALLDLSAKPGKAAQLGLAARDHVHARHTPAVEAQRYLALLGSVVAGHPAGGAEETAALRTLSPATL